MIFFGKIEKKFHQIKRKKNLGTESDRLTHSHTKFNNTELMVLSLSLAREKKQQNKMVDFLFERKKRIRDEKMIFGMQKTQKFFFGVEKMPQ